MNENQSFKEDKRFKQCNKELIYTFGLFIINILLVSAISFFEYGKSADEITIVAGFPAWFFYGCIISSVLLCVMTFFMVRGLFKEMSLEAYIEEDNE